MKQIIATRKMENGIACYLDQAGQGKFESFTFEELIASGINALDLLNDPENYAVDTEKHRVIMKK